MAATASTSLPGTARYGFGGGRHFLSAGLTVFHGFAEAEEYANTGLSGAVGGEAELTGWLRPSLQLRYTFTDYQAREALAPESRTDNEWTATAGMAGSLTPRWSYGLLQQWTHNDSTFGLYEYDRNVTTLSTSVKF